MGRARRRAAWLPLLLAFGLSARAEVPVRSGELPEPEERHAEALANAARGLVLSGAPETGAAARAAFEAAIRLDPFSRSPYRLLARHLSSAGRTADLAALAARTARTFGARTDWRRALALAVAARESGLAREASAALSARARAQPSDPDSAADLAAVALAMCRLGEGADAAPPFRLYLRRAADPAIVPADEPPRVFSFCIRALLSGSDDAEAEILRAAGTLFELFRDAPLPCPPTERADALSDAIAALSGKPAATGLLRRMAIEGLRLVPSDYPLATVLAIRGVGPADPTDAGRPDTPALLSAFAARPEAAGLGYSFALARAVCETMNGSGPDAAAATNALAEAEAAWRAEHPGEPLPPDHAAIRLELLSRLGLGAVAVADALAGLPEDLRGLDPSFANNLAYTLACEGGDLDLALRLSDRSLALDPDSPEAQDTLGWIFHLRGDDDEALEMLMRAVRRSAELDRRSAELYDHLGDVLAALGRETEAVAAWSAASFLEPSGVSAGKLRARGFDPAPSAPPAEP